MFIVLGLKEFTKKYKFERNADKEATKGCMSTAWYNKNEGDSLHFLKFQRKIG
jgi:hypothetical protein